MTTIINTNMPTRSRIQLIALRLGGLLLLVLLAVLLIQRSTARLDQDQVVGTFRTVLPPTFDDTIAPATVELHSDGRIRTSGPGGAFNFEGTWAWDDTGGWVSSDVPELHQRIRGYRGWTGPAVRRIRQDMCDGGIVLKIIKP